MPQSDKEIVDARQLFTFSLEAKLRSHHRKLIEILEINPDIKISL